MSGCSGRTVWKINIDGRAITYVRFADGLYVQAEEEQELVALLKSLDFSCTRYIMEISAEKNSQLMTKSTNGIQREIKIKEAGYSQKLHIPWDIVLDERFKRKVLSRIAQAI